MAGGKHLLGMPRGRHVFGTVKVGERGQIVIPKEARELFGPDFVGFKKPEMNVGKVNNKGFELTARYADRINDFNYYVQGGVWYAHNEVKYNAEMLQQYSYMYRTGHRVDQPFGLQAIGFFKDQKDIDDSPQHTFMKVQPGDIKYKDMNNDGVINENDICAIGYTNLPEFTYSFNLGFAYKGFDLDA